MIIRKILLYIYMCIIIFVGLCEKCLAFRSGAHKLATTSVYKNSTTHGHYDINNQNTASPVVAKIQLMVTRVELMEKQDETEYNKQAYNYTLDLTLVTQRDFFNMEATLNPNSHPFSTPLRFGFDTPRNISFHLKIFIFNKTNFEINEFCDENVLTPIPNLNGNIFARLCRNKFKITFMFNYTCATKKNSRIFCEDDSTPLYYDMDQYQCKRGNFCQSLMNPYDFFTCFQHEPTTTGSTSVTSTTTTSTRRPTSTTTTTKFVTSSSSTSSTKIPEEQLEANINNFPSSLVPKIKPREEMYWWDREICISTIAAIAVLGCLIAVLILNICCLMTMKKNHGSYHELFCGSTKPKKDQAQTYHGNEDLYSQPWDGKENATLDHLFVSMPDIRENLVRNSDHIYAVPQIPQNLNNIVQYRKLPDDTVTDTFPASVISNDSECIV